MQPRSGKTQEKDEFATIKELISSRELQIIHFDSKVLKLRERSQILNDNIEDNCAKTKEQIDALGKEMALLTRIGKEFDSKIMELEKSIDNLKMDRIESHGALLNAMDDLKQSHSIASNDLQLQLDRAKLELQEVHSFPQRKKALKEEISGLKELLDKEREVHVVAKKVRGQAVDEAKEKYTSEIDRAIKETKEQMSNRTEELLHPLSKLKEMFHVIAKTPSIGAAEDILKIFCACLDFDMELAQAAESFKCSHSCNKPGAAIASLCRLHCINQGQKDSLRDFLHSVLSLQPSIYSSHIGFGEAQKQCVLSMDSGGDSMWQKGSIEDIFTSTIIFDHMPPVIENRKRLVSVNVQTPPLDLENLALETSI